MNKKITTAIILAAGFGKRMQPLTNNIPKPLIEVAGKPMLGWIIDNLKQVGIKNIVVNTHYLADKISQYLATRTDMNISISYEKEILDTGGGVKNIIPNLDTEEFLVINGDIFWLDIKTQKSALELLLDNWDSDKMDILIMLYNKHKLPKFNSLAGDYDIDDKGKLTYKIGGKYVFAGPRIVKSSIFKNITDDKFSFKILFDKAEDKNKLYGSIYEGKWYHVGTLEELEYTNNEVKKLI